MATLKMAEPSAQTERTEEPASPFLRRARIRSAASPREIEASGRSWRPLRCRHRCSTLVERRRRTASCLEPLDVDGVGVGQREAVPPRLHRGVAVAERGLEVVERLDRLGGGLRRRRSGGEARR